MALMIRSLYIKDLDVVLLHFKTGALVFGFLRVVKLTYIYIYIYICYPNLLGAGTKDLCLVYCT